MRLFSMTVPAIVLLSFYTGKKPIPPTIAATPVASAIPESLVEAQPLACLPNGLSPEAYTMALRGYQRLRKVGQLHNTHVLTIIDYTLSSLRKRLFVVDLRSGKVLYNTYVAHGMNSGKEYARKFSNALQSLESSLGFYVTMNSFNGKNGLALRLRGVERGINDNATRRGIVLHGATYVGASYGRQQGFMGRSEGCPAVPPKETAPIVHSIRNGSAVFVYYPSALYLGKSKLLAYNGIDTTPRPSRPLP